VRAISVTTDGSGDVYVAGFFDDYNGTSNNGIARLNSDGTLDSGFVTTGLLVTLGKFITPAIDGSGDIYVGGGFTRYNLIPAAGITRLTAGGAFIR
jgi:hypothetical protein